MNGSHPEYGPIHDCFKKYLQQGYLTKIKSNTQEETHLYVWGPRAKAVFTEEKVIEFMVSMYPEADAERQEVLKNAILLSADGV
jgi:hypothetical protein